MNLRPGFGGGLVAVERAGDSLGCKVKVEKRLKTGNMYQMCINMLRGPFVLCSAALTMFV